MKKTFKTFALMLAAVLAFSSCADIPAPYNMPEKDSRTGGGSSVVAPAGDGTLASPYNVAAIVAMVKEMEAGVESTEEYYIKGKVLAVTTTEATIAQYGNHTFTMVDEGNNSTVFTAFQVYGPGKKKFTSVNDIKVGDEVVVCGKVVNFKGNTPETVGKGSAYVVSINSSGSGEQTAKTVTCAEAVELTNALADGGTSTETYSVTGYITEVIGNVSRNQQTFWMADTKDGGKVFEAYWANLPEGVSEFKVGMKVTITGQLMKYVKGTDVTPEIKNADVVILEDGGGDTPVPVGTEITCAEAVELTNALADGGTSTETYSVTGYITEVIGNVSRNQQTFWMADTKDGGKVFEAYWANLPEGVSEFKVGMKVTITGQLMKYVKGTDVTPEIKNADVVILEDGGGDTPVPVGTEITCAEAVELTNALADGGTSTETYSVTGYITEVIGNVSRNQQTFWMADTKDGGKVFEAYWANLPEGVSEFKVGMKVTITGQLMKYVKGTDVTPEIKNADVVILEDGGGDTPVPVGTEITCAEAVELTNALADGGTSTETYSVTGYITEVIGNVSRNQQTFWMADTKDGGKVFEAYWANLPVGVSAFAVGMKVKITGQLMKYVKGTDVTPEIKNADVVILEDGGGVEPGPGPEPGGDPVTDLVNGNFENWDNASQPTGWKSACSASNAELAQSTDARSGSYACVVKAPGTTNKRLATQEMTLEAGTYTFSYYAKSTTANPSQTRGGYVPVNANGSVGTYQYSKTYADLNNNDWTLVSYDFTLESATTICLIVMNPKDSSYSVSQDILVDDATLVKK